MLAQTPDRARRTFSLIAPLFFSALLFTSCASTKDTALISDPNAKGETALPWNQQEKWEREGEMGALTQGRR